MSLITTKQSFSRYLTLPQNIRDALFSIQTAEIVGIVGAKNSVPEEKNPLIAKATGLVLLGFIHPEDLSKELQDSLQVSPQLATALSNDLAARLFNPIRADIDKIYAPVLREHESGISMSSGSAPKIIVEEIKSSGPTPAKLPPLAAAPAPQRPNPTSSFSSTSTPKIVMEQIAPSAPVIKKPDLAATGWSKTNPSAFAQPPAPKTPLATPTPTPTPKTPAAAGPAPVMLHQDTTFKPAQQPSDFHLQRTMDTTFDMQKGAVPMPPKPAVIEFGRSTATTPSAPPAPAPTTSTTRVVHYTDYKSPSPETPVAPQGPRQVTEITMSTPGVAPESKVIHKDYSAPAASNMPSTPLPPKPPQPPMPPLAR